MDSRFRGIDGRPPTYAPRPSATNVSYFTEQAIRVGYSGPNFRNTTEYLRNPNAMIPMREAVRRELEKEQIRAELRRELEKEQIRAEIMAAETARRRALEVEVRREMLAEREMALRGGGGNGSTTFLGFEPRHSILQQQFEGRSLEERFSSSTGRSIGGGFETLPFQRIIEPKIMEVKPTSNVFKEKVIFMAKPEGSTSGTKRKAAIPPPAGASEPHSVGSKKKSKEEWSCALCQVSATSEQGLNEHLQGKKHKSKVAGLTTQKAGKSHAIGFCPRRTSKPMKLAEPSNDKNLDQLPKSIHKEVKPDNDLVLVVDRSDSKNKNGDLHKMQKGAKRKKIQKTKDRFKFWCELCKVGAFSEKVLNRHKKGKKHVGQLERLEEESRSGIVAELDEATKVGPKDDDEERTENELDGFADGEVEENQEL